jgi:hypothetical protein
VAVDLDNVPTKSVKLVGEPFNAIGLSDARALLQRVPLDDEGQIGELVVSGRHRGFPIAALL